jgi:hypothetical protein
LTPDIQANGLPDVGWPKRVGKYYVELTLGQNNKKTALAARGNMMPRGTTTFTCEPTEKLMNLIQINSLSGACGSCLLELDVYAHRKIGGDDCIGGVKEEFDIHQAPGGLSTYSL